MACKDAKIAKATAIAKEAESVQSTKKNEAIKYDRLYFGVQTTCAADTVLQNNLTLMDWVIRNKTYPNFWGRNITGANSLTEKEVMFIHSKGCKVAMLFAGGEEMKTEQQGGLDAAKAVVAAKDLGSYIGSTIFLCVGEKYVPTEYLKGFAVELIAQGFTPGFKADTDSKSTFDREFSRGMQTHKEVFSKCIIWAEAPALKEYERVTTTHLIYPDLYTPFAPSGTTRKDIAIWQYGKDCHPINDEADNEVTFNVNLVRDERIIIEKMF